MLGIELPDRDDVASWATRGGAGIEEAVVRILVSAGDDPFDGPARVVVTGEPAPAQPASITLAPIVAPWHSDGVIWELLRAKTLSYANNLGAIREANRAGFTDAMLIGRSGRLLEGPTFSIGWVVREGSDVVYETPALSLGILDSITREVAFDAAREAGLAFREVEVRSDRLDDATEVFVLSTLRDAVPVTAVGDRSFELGPAVRELRDAMVELTRREVGRDRDS